MLKKHFIIWIALPAFILGGCAVLTFYKKVDKLIVAGDYAGANALVDKEKKSYKGEHELLFYFDKGSLLQMTGDYKGSTEYLDKAELKIEQLYTKSVSAEVSSYFVNDTKLPYEGEDFEKVMVHIMKALNFMYMNKFSSAQVEARKVNHLMNVISDRVDGKNKYKEDAFARYLSGFAYEAKRDINDAYIDYKHSYKVYKVYNEMYGTPIPMQVKKDILRTAAQLGFNDDVREWKKEFGGDVSYIPYKDLRTKGEVLLVIYDGMAPYKKSVKQSATVFEKPKEKINPAVISVAFPKFQKRGYVVGSVTVEEKGKTKNSFISEDVAEIAVKTLQEKNGLISAKAIARAGVKYFAGRAIRGKGDNAFLNLATNLFSYVTEEADTRSWRTLPARFHLVRIPLKPGRHTLNAKINLAVGGQRPLPPISVKLKAGQKKVIPIFAFN